MQNHAVRCPECRAIVDMHHDGSRTSADDYTSPWVFVDHRNEDQPDDPGLCGASGHNLTDARERVDQ